jgi:hypothetical protein
MATRNADEIPNRYAEGVPKLRAGSENTVRCGAR